ncbi:leucine--tRNA ligase [Marinigracilibium pacificum]|uniref:Leucine--tRNA ligase n=1 Tax=Marinigracilibium pacificum TaxID=2729599 RepID=A0A848J1A2_9BACT|nr:leucine--tRNA ligase [Marinigracilibium pacificum]NMM48079.1 leucine--tRNA ligase [Marinigracilibium pacificum]
MPQYDHKAIEAKWKKFWKENKTYQVTEDTTKPKFYALDMFPYPSGAGLHVGHPLGYIASDIVARYKRNKGFNVLHPMGFDSFGLPAEQYAIQTGQHPAITTAENIKRYKEQLENIGFSYDMSREVQTSSPEYYKWTQWIFMQLFNHYYDNNEDKAVPVSILVEKLKTNGSAGVNATCDDDTPQISADDWQQMNEDEQQKYLLHYRLAFLSDAIVNWCPGLGTVLANDEVKDGVSERGGFPVERKKMRQWSLRITAYADRLLKGLETIEWPEAVKEMQKNWIGKSVGAQVTFDLENSDHQIKVFTTRVDTIYGVTFLVLAPESEIIDDIVTAEQKEKVDAYVTEAKNRSERERMTDVKNISGVFTGAHGIHPFTGEKVPVWVADYVLGGYGTGAVMAVPSGDQRDYDFAKHFDLPIVQIIDAQKIEDQADPTKEGKMVNSGFINGLSVTEATKKAIEILEEKGKGFAKINYRMRDAVFSRQRYWGEPIPVYFKNEVPYLINESELPLELPEVDKYLPTEDGEPPLARAENWKTSEGYEYEKSTMPGWAGSSWYLFRYMDPKNENTFADKEILKYWKNVDLYIGGSEHATGHLLYSRFWTKFLKDIGYLTVEEPFKKLVNQGMIQGRSNFAYRVKDSHKFVSYNLKDDYDVSAIHVDVSLVHGNDELDTEAFKSWRPDLKDAEFILEDGKYICGWEVEKMSKSKYNVVNPDDIIEQYGADTLRMYEMFLGPLEQFKPWNTHGIDGVAKFLRKFWKLFYNEEGELIVNDTPADKKALKVTHATIKKTIEDIDSLSFNTVVSAFMICTNELTKMDCHSKEVLEPLVIALSPFAPHICEELWEGLGNSESITKAEFPSYNETYLVEDSHEYPIMINGKMRTKISFSLDTPVSEMEQTVKENEVVQKWLEGKDPKKIIVVPKKIVNVVI